MRDSRLLASLWPQIASSRNHLADPCTVHFAFVFFEGSSYFYGKSRESILTINLLPCESGHRDIVIRDVLTRLLIKCGREKNRPNNASSLRCSLVTRLRTDNLQVGLKRRSAAPTAVRNRTDGRSGRWRRGSGFSFQPLRPSSVSVRSVHTICKDLSAEPRFPAQKCITMFVGCAASRPAVFRRCCFVCNVSNFEGIKG